MRLLWDSDTDVLSKPDGAGKIKALRFTGMFDEQSKRQRIP